MINFKCTLSLASSKAFNSICWPDMKRLFGKNYLFQSRNFKSSKKNVCEKKPNVFPFVMLGLWFK